MKGSGFRLAGGSMEFLHEIADLFNQYRMCTVGKGDIELATDFIRQRIENKESLIVICIDTDRDRVVGFTQIYPKFSLVTCTKDYILKDLYILLEYRNMGIATSILEQAKHFTIGDEPKNVTLEAAINNPARKLYEKLGWKSQREFVHYHYIR